MVLGRTRPAVSSITLLSQGGPDPRAQFLADQGHGHADHANTVAATARLVW